MFVDLSFADLLTISCALHTLDNVYGETDARTRVRDLVDAQMEIMNNAPVTEVYPNLKDYFVEK